MLWKCYFFRILIFIRKLSTRREKKKKHEKLFVKDYVCVYFEDTNISLYNR